MQALLTYVQLASLLGLLDIKWLSLLGGLFKAFAWITHVNPQVCHPVQSISLDLLRKSKLQTCACAFVTGCHGFDQCVIYFAPSIPALSARCNNNSKS
jgi:hypothetical protein